MGCEPMTGPERDLLARFQEGDDQALAELVATMGPRLKAYFLRQGAQVATAEDLTQDVFLRVYRGAQHYRPGGRLDAWLLRIARNLWIDHRRRRHPQTGADEIQAAVHDPGLGPRQCAERGDRAAALRAALAAREPAERELLELAVLQQLPYKEVAMILSIPTGTVKSRVYYALRRLRATLAALEDEWRELPTEERG